MLGIGAATVLILCCALAKTGLLYPSRALSSHAGRACTGRASGNPILDTLCSAVLSTLMDTGFFTLLPSAITAVDQEKPVLRSTRYCLPECGSRQSTRLLKSPTGSWRETRQLFDRYRSGSAFTAGSATSSLCLYIALACGFLSGEHGWSGG